MRDTKTREIDLKYRGILNDVKTITLEVSNVYLDVEEFEIYDLS